MAKRKVGDSTRISLTRNKKIDNKPCQFTIDGYGYGREKLTINKWNEFLSGPPKEIDLGVDLLEDPSSMACYFLDDLGSMRFKGLDGIVYYVFIDDDDVPYHIDPSQVYIYKPGEEVIPGRLPEGYHFYITNN